MDVSKLSFVRKDSTCKVLEDTIASFPFLSFSFSFFLVQALIMRIQALGWYQKFYSVYRRSFVSLYMYSRRMLVSKAF
jgi:hypothetical protein